MYNTLVIIYWDNYHYWDNFTVHYRDNCWFFHYRTALVSTHFTTLFLIVCIVTIKTSGAHNMLKYRAKYTQIKSNTLKYSQIHSNTVKTLQISAAHNLQGFPWRVVKQCNTTLLFSKCLWKIIKFALMSVVNRQSYHSIWFIQGGWTLMH